MKLTSFIGYNGDEIFIDTDKIMGVSKDTEETTILTMQAGSCSEEWRVKMSVKQVIERIQP